MSFASQIISSVKNKSHSNANSSDTTSMQTASQNTKEEDIGFKTDINTEIKKSTPMYSNSANKSMNNVTSSSNTSNTSSATTSKSPRSSNSTAYIPAFSMFAIGNYTMIVVFLLILILHHYNIEVFSVLGDTLDGLISASYKLLQSIANLFSPFIQTVYTLLYGTAKETTKTSATGLKKAADTNAKVIGELTDPIIGDTENKDTSSNNSETKTDIRKKKIEIRKEVSAKLKQQVNKQSEKKTSEPVKTDDANSSIQSAGWCYIGNDEGVRKCVNIDDNNECMSGLIYKNQEDCLNGA
jgi:hypothetical protein